MVNFPACDCSLLENIAGGMEDGCCITEAVAYVFHYNIHFHFNIHKTDNVFCFNKKVVLVGATRGDERGQKCSL